MNKALHLALHLLISSFSVNAAQLDQPAPSCPARFSDSQATVNPGLYKGKVVLLDFWATWCPPCIKSMPFFNNLRNELQAKGFEILAINVDEDQEAVAQFLNTHSVDYPIAMDPEGECPKIYEVTAMPSSYLIDKSGAIKKIHLGFRDGDQSELREHIEKLLKE